MDRMNSMARSGHTGILIWVRRLVSADMLPPETKLSLSLAGLSDIMAHFETDCCDVAMALLIFSRMIATLPVFAKHTEGMSIDLCAWWLQVCEQNVPNSLVSHVT